MSIERKCENCIFNDENYSPFNIVCDDCKEVQKEDNCFYPKEELVRQDTLNETIKIDNDIEISLQASTYTIDELLMIIKIANNSSNIFKKYEKEK